MALKSVQIYEIYVNHVLYTGFRYTYSIIHIINFLYAISKELGPLLQKKIKSSFSHLKQ